MSYHASSVGISFVSSAASGLKIDCRGLKIDCRGLKIDCRGLKIDCRGLKIEFLVQEVDACLLYIAMSAY